MSSRSAWKTGPARASSRSRVATSSSTRCAFAIRRSTARSMTGSPSAFRPASASAWSDGRARARRPSSSWCSGCTTSMVDGSRSTARTSPTSRQESLRRQVAIVQQEPVLFHRSLADNIAYGRPDATMAEIEAAARLAHADVFVERLPQRYATLVGERGVKLSGGERQRVAIARAFLANAPILILDEATSSLDSESEALIQDAMQHADAGPHDARDRPPPLHGARARPILVFDHGRVVEDGNHAALMRIKGGIYRRLVERQAEGHARKWRRSRGGVPALAAQ